MPDLLLELFSEEIPARMQVQAAADLRKLVTDRLVDAGLVYDGAKAFVTPRRLALSVHGIPARQADLRDEKKGPRVGAPENAIAGFLKAAGLKSIADAKIQSDKKGDFYVAVIERPAAALDVLAKPCPGHQKLPWPKLACCVQSIPEPGALEWARPLHSIVRRSPETEEPEIVPFAVDGIAAAMRRAPSLRAGAFTVRRLDDYMDCPTRLVVLDAERRRDIIAAEATAASRRARDRRRRRPPPPSRRPVEWPVVLMGLFDAPLHIPEEVIRATIRNNQKCFVLREARQAGQQVHPRFQYGGRRRGKAIVAGKSVSYERASRTRSFFTRPI
jgi:glycyl-tRNA synthetase beta chain